MSVGHLAKHIAIRDRSLKATEQTPWIPPSTNVVRTKPKVPVTPQTIKSTKGQVKNNAGGYVFKLDKWVTLDRFLILGSEGGTYYATERKLTIDNAILVEKCVEENGVRVVNRIVEISEAGRAPKNDPALMALAICVTVGDSVTRRHAMTMLPKVARIGTHLFHFAEFVNGLRGWGRVLKEGVANWYQSKNDDELANQLIKYVQRDGWSHRDMLRLSHPKADNDIRNNMYRWVVKGKEGITHGALMPPVIIGAEMIKLVDTTKKVVDLIRQYNLPREVVPTHFLNDAEVWKTLMPGMKPTAMIRNLGKMTSIGLLSPNSEMTAHVVNTLTDAEAIRKAKVHPITILLALKTYASGKGLKGSLVWTPVAQITNALNEAFYLAFGNIKPTGKRTLLGLDVSGSMDTSRVPGTSLTAREATAAMAMVTARVEKQWYAMGFGHTFHDLSNIVHPGARLDGICKAMKGLPFNRTDCSLPMMWALQNKVPVDTFIIYTDNETYAGSIHPHEALIKYRVEMGIDAKLIVVGTSATPFTIANPTNPNMLDVVGFDSATPEIISGFSSGEF